jgi:hypothetical protein
MMAYNAKIVVGAWEGNTQAGGGGSSISTFGTQVGQTALAEFINGMPQEYSGLPARPADGLVDGKGCPGQPDASHEIFLTGTDKLPCNSTPSPSPTPTSTATAAPVTPLPSLPVSPLPTAPLPTPTPAPSATPKPAATP